MDWVTHKLICASVLLIFTPYRFDSFWVKHDHYESHRCSFFAQESIKFNPRFSSLSDRSVKSLSQTRFLFEKVGIYGTWLPYLDNFSLLYNSINFLLLANYNLTKYRRVRDATYNISQKNHFNQMTDVTGNEVCTLYI